MTKIEIINLIQQIDELLQESKKFIDYYQGMELPVDSSMARLCEYTRLLIIERFRLKQMLLDNYGIFYM